MEGKREPENCSIVSYEARALHALLFTLFPGDHVKYEMKQNAKKKIVMTHEP